MEYDYLIVGAGLFGAICARELTDNGFSCLIIEKRSHIGGNCYSEKMENINVHKYGPHIFHTSNKEVWDYINNYTDFNTHRLHVVANYKNKIYSLPFNMFTFNQLWGVTTPEEAQKIINSQKFNNSPKNLEECALAMVGKDIYEKLIKGYIEKQWMKSAKDLPSFIIKRLPVRFTYDNDYFSDSYEGMPINGYDELFKRLLLNIKINLNTDFYSNREYFEKISKRIIFTGTIDKFYNYKFGQLEYRGLKFENQLLNKTNYQGAPVISFTEFEVPHTRIIEHKHFNNDVSDVTIITKEFSISPKNNDDLFYPINDDLNQKMYNKYKKMADKELNVVFGGRIAEYKYYDMDKTIESAFLTIKKELKK